jgi:hypothetical protein
MTGDVKSEVNQGITPRAMKQLFAEIDELQQKGVAEIKVRRCRRLMRQAGALRHHLTIVRNPLRDSLLAHRRSVHILSNCTTTSS